MRKISAFIIFILIFSAMTSFTVSSAPNEIVSVKAEAVTFSFEPDSNERTGDICYETLSVTDADGQTTAYAKVEDLWEAIGYYLTFDEREKAYIIDDSAKFGAKMAPREAKVLPYTRATEVEKEKIAFPPLSFLKPLDVYAAEDIGGTYVYNIYKILYWDKLLDLGGKKLLSVTGGSHEGVYLPLEATAEALGYYVGWDSFNENILISRYEEEALNADIMSMWEFYYGEETEANLIKWMSEDEIKTKAAGHMWEKFLEEEYVAFEIAADGTYVLTVKNYTDTEERFSKSMGTWKARKGGMDFFQDSELEYDAYGEVVAFSQPLYGIVPRIRVGYVEGNPDIIFVGGEIEEVPYYLSISPYKKKW